MGWLRRLKDEAKADAVANRIFAATDAEPDRPIEVSSEDAFWLSKFGWATRRPCRCRRGQDFATETSLFSVSLYADYARPEIDRRYFDALFEAIRETVRDFALKAKPGEDGAAKPAEKTQREVAPTVRVGVERAESVAGDALEDEREARTAVDGFGLDETKRAKLGGDNGVLPAERDGDGGAQPRQ